MNDDQPADATYSRRNLRKLWLVVCGSLARVAGLLVVGYWGMEYLLGNSIWNNNDVGAREKAQVILDAVREYRSRYQEYPTTLEDLVLEMDGRKPVLVGGKYALMSPLGFAVRVRGYSGCG